MTAQRTIEQQFSEAFKSSEAQYRRAVEAIAGGITHDVRHMKPFPLYIDNAKGSRKWDLDGHELIDFVMGHGALLFGHGHGEIIDAVNQQAMRGTHYGAGHELEIEWGERIKQIVPSVERVEFTSSGTEATLMAMRLARAYTGRDKILKFAGHFHGWHDYAMAGEKYPWDKPVAGVPQAVLDTVVVSPVNDIDFVEQALSNGDIAAVILEPSGASWASIPVPDGFLKQLRELTEKHNTVLIFDEVITGFRWAPGGKQESEGVTPDMTTMAKIVAGGLPGGAVGGRHDIMELLEFKDEPGWNADKKVGHPGTYNANPLAAIAGSACLQMAANPRVQKHADDMAARFRAGVNKVLTEENIPGFCWGESSIFHIILGETCDNQNGGDIRVPEGVAPERLKGGSDAKYDSALYQGMLLNGVDLFHGGGLVSSVHTEDDIDQSIEAFRATVTRMREEGLFS